jgi:hypothetical protein
MAKPLISLTIVISAISLLGSPGCTKGSGGDNKSNRIVGTWVVEDTAAPFHYHMYVFNADGTMQQANPDAGDANTSDSDGKGVWLIDGDHIKGKFVEVTADRLTHQFVSRGEISYEIRVDAKGFTGTAIARFYDLNDRPVQSPISTSLVGKRVTLP